MVYCSHCGAAVEDGAVVCTACGFEIKKQSKKSQGLKTAIKVLMVLGTIVMGLYIVPLLWAVPMTIVAFKKIDKGESFSTAFKVCTLLFVNTIAGILMLCDDENN